jgi:hypothetical protein
VGPVDERKGHSIRQRRFARGFSQR